MLEAIGAGTVAAVSNTDFARYYKESALCAANIIYTDALCNDSDTTSPATEKECRYIYTLYVLYIYTLYILYVYTIYYKYVYVCICTYLILCIYVCIRQVIYV